MEAKVEGVGMSWKKYTEIDEAINKARTMLGVNYYIEPIAKEYIQKFKMAKKQRYYAAKYPNQYQGRRIK
jgi:hypothetical protein